MVTRPQVRPVRTSKRALICAWGALIAIVTGAAPPALSAPPRATAASADTVLASCSWDRPGHNPFMGDVVAAVDRYADIPASVRSRLKQRMASRQYDEIVSIGRDRISGKQRYDSEIRDMHFGPGSVCRSVTRARWSAQMQERGLVYCEAGHCILVPTVCRNVSRIVRRDAPTAATGTQTPAAAGEPELLFEPPGAGGGTPVAGPVAGEGGSGGAQSFASRSAETLPAPLYAGSSNTGSGVRTGRPSGSPLEGDAAEPGHMQVPGIGDPGPLPAPYAEPMGPYRPEMLSSPVPEPHTWWMLAIGLAAVGARRRHRATACGKSVSPATMPQAH